MDLLLKLSQGIDAVNRRIGQFFALMVLLAILVSAINATVRKVFDLSSNAWLELQWVLFSMVFLFCAPWTLHVERACAHRHREQHAAPARTQHRLSSSATPSSSSP